MFAEYNKSGEENITDQQDYQGNTPLHLSASLGSMQIMKLLIVKGRADVNIENHDEACPTVLHIAASTGNLGMVCISSAKGLFFR